MRSGREIGRFVASLVAIAVLVVGVPALLVAAAQARFGSANPLAGVDWPWRWFGDGAASAASEPIADSTVLDALIRGSLCVAWVALAVIVVTTVLETVHLARHGGLPRPDIHGLGWAQRIGRTIAAGLIVVLPLASSSVSIAQSVRSPAVRQPTVAAWVEDVRPNGAPEQAEDASPPGEATVGDVSAPTRHVVQRGESVYAIAERIAARTGVSTIEVADAILDANLGRAMGPGERFTNPAYVEVGWVLEIPARYAGGAATVLVESTPADAQRPGPTDEDEPTAVVTAGATGIYVVQRGDTLWDIAGAQLGDPTAWPQIWERNAGRDMGGGRSFDDPNLILPGWELHLSEVAPSADEIRDDAVPDDAPDDQIDDAGQQTAEDFWDTVDQPANEAEPGNETRPAAEVDEPGDVVDEQDVVGAQGDAVAGQGDEVGRHGDDVGVPGAGGEPGAGREPGDAVDEPGVSGEPDASGELPDDPRDWPVTVDPDGPASADAPSSTTDASQPPDTTQTTAPAIRFDDMIPDPSADDASAAPSTMGTTPTTSDAPVAGASGSEGTDRPAADPAPDAPSPIRLEHAALLAAGILALVGVRRRQRLRSARPRHRVPAPPMEVVDTERRLRAIEPGERALRVDVATRAIACALRSTDARIGWIEVSVDGDLDVRLTEPSVLPPPWSGVGEEWRLAADVPIELLAEDARQVDMPCLALVQVGVTPAGGEVLVDVEACGMLAIEATPRQGDEVVTAIAAGLASSLYAEVAHLIAVSLDEAALLGHRNAHLVDSSDAALDLAAALVGTTFANERTTFVLRSLRTGGEMWEPAVVLLRNGDISATGDVARLCPAPGHGLAVVAAGGAGFGAPSAARIVAEADGWRLDGFGGSIELTPLGLSGEEVRAVAAVLDDADRPLESLELAAADDVRWADSRTGDDGDGHDDGVSGEDSVDDATDAVPFVPRPHEIVVGLLGGVTVTSRDGTSGTFERSKTVELIAWLVTHRERSTRSNARAALWELDVRDATFANVVSEARRALARLVPPPEGVEWVARTLTDQLPVHDLVVTDAELVDDRLDHARLQPPAAAMETLRPAVEMIRDLPFAGTSYLWPDAEGIASNLVLLAMTAATEFAGHALSLGDTDGVFWATAQGLKMLPGHEELIALRMQAHARAGDLAGVRHEWESYERVLTAESWSDGEPAPKLVALRHELLSA